MSNLPDWQVAYRLSSVIQKPDSSMYWLRYPHSNATKGTNFSCFLADELSTFAATLWKIEYYKSRDGWAVCPDLNPKLFLAILQRWMLLSTQAEEQFGISSASSFHVSPPTFINCSHSISERAWMSLLTATSLCHHLDRKLLELQGKHMIFYCGLVSSTEFDFS